MKIFIGADHRGFALKELLKQWLQTQSYEVIDCGNTHIDSEDDYPVFAFSVAEKVATDKNSRGVILCGSGGGVTIAANKVIGIRAAVGVTTADVVHNREHNDINILAIASDETSQEDAKKFLNAFLTTDFRNEPKYQRRIDQISERETA